MSIANVPISPEVMRLEAIALIPPVTWERMRIEGIELIVEGDVLKAMCDRLNVLDLADEIGLLEALAWLDRLPYFAKLEYWNAYDCTGRMYCSNMPASRWLAEKAKKQRRG